MQNDDKDELPWISTNLIPPYLSLFHVTASISGYDYLDKILPLTPFSILCVFVCVQSNYREDHLFSFEYNIHAQGTELMNETKSSQNEKLQELMLLTIYYEKKKGGGKLGKVEK